MLVCEYVKYFSEISTGLDASVTFDIVHNLKQKVVANQLSVVISMLQPTPEVYNLFDNVILMREGCVVCVLYYLI